MASSSLPSGCTNFKLRQLTRRVSQHYDHHLALAGLKTTQYSLLSHIAKLGPLTPGELARRMTLDASTLTRNLQPLVAAGWVVVGEGVNARSRLLTLTEAGREVRQAAQRHWKNAQLELNGLLGPALVADLHGLLDQALAAFEPETSDE
jgi:DNA-binding MarR family transcriptional regulator